MWGAWFIGRRNPKLAHAEARCAKVWTVRRRAAGTLSDSPALGMQVSVQVSPHQGGVLGGARALRDEGENPATTLMRENRGNGDRLVRQAL